MTDLQTTDDHRWQGHWIGYQSWCDAYYCLTCGVWTEPKCSDPECMFCTERPEWPSWTNGTTTITTNTTNLGPTRD